MQKQYGKLLHASLVMPAGHAHLTSLEAMLGSFDNCIFLPHTPPYDTLGDLGWWKQQLSQPKISRPILKPQPLVNYNAYSDASSGFGVAITIGSKWHTWQLAAGWKFQALHAKQSFQSNKTLRKPSGVLTTYQGLFFRKTSKKEFKFDLGGTTERKLYKKT